ncbi:electron transport complex subunit RsxC, partial [Proteus terrae]
VQSALSRVKAKQSIGKIISVKAGEEPDNAAAIAARKKRKEEVRAKQAAKLAQQKALEASSENIASESKDADPRKAAVAAALARVKAKKAQQANETTSTVETPAQNVEVE